MLIKPRDYQREAIDSIFKYFNTHKEGNPLIAMPTGCHAKGHPILMYDGSIKPIEEITVGEQVMGPDSLPRTVLKLARGRQEMRRIIPNNGKPFVVNLDHKILAHVTKQGGPSKLRQQRDEVITIRQYEEGSDWYRHLRKLQRSKISFPETEQVIPAYILGILLGDGCLCNGTVSLTTNDTEIKDAFISYLNSIGLNNRIYNKYENSNTVDVHTIDPNANRSNQNKLTRMLRSLFLMEKRSHDKFIPKNYRIASEEQRLELLAGLIDTDGHYSAKNNYFEYCTVSEKLAEGVEFISRSLGLRCSLTKSDNAYRINISGNIDTIPTRLKRKQATPSAKQKNCLVTGFKVEPLPEDNYYGFTLSGDHLYLDGEFIVHHNTGKSIVIAGFLYQVLQQYCTQKIMVLTHVKELIEQNHAKFVTAWPHAPAGIYSAGLNKRNTGNNVIFAGIGSVVKRAAEFGRVDLLIIDECHLVSPNQNTMYQKFITDLMLINPYLRVIGLTATPWRLGHGHLTDEGGMFTDVCFDITGLVAFNRLIAEGYLAPVYPRRTSTKLDTDGVHMRGGEFIQSELQIAVDKQEITYAALQETMELAHDKNHWLIFGTGIEHCYHIQEMLTSFGVDSCCVHSSTQDYKMTAKQRDENIAGFKSGKYRALINNNVLTTGFDFPNIDNIVMLRPTESPVLWVQMIGRGTRPVYGRPDCFDLNTIEGRLSSIAAGPKPNGCLVLDFAGNTERIGPINDPKIPTRKGSKGGTAPVKICERCEMYNHASVKFCVCCGHEFKFEVKIRQEAGTADLIKGDLPVVEDFQVEYITYSLHTKVGKPNMIKVSYYCGFRMFNEYVCLEHTGFAGKKAQKWWKDRTNLPIPENCEDALDVITSAKAPTDLRVWINKKYPEILSYCFDGSHFGKREPVEKPNVPVHSDHERMNFHEDNPF